jgi:hypothetical protein
VLGRQKTWSYFASQEPRKESQGKGTEGVITSATIGGQSSEGGNFVVVNIVVVCQEIFTFFVVRARFFFFGLSCGSCGFGFRQESTALWSLRMCGKILRVVVVGRKKMTVLCIGNKKALFTSSTSSSSSSAALLAHAFLLPQFL